MELLKWRDELGGAETVTNFISNMVTQVAVKLLELHYLSLSGIFDQKPGCLHAIHVSCSYKGYL